MRYPLNLLFSGIIAAIAAMLFACTDSTSTPAVANGGVTGTGITMGRITNFGSIYVNGVRFDVDDASFSRDEKPSQGQVDFSVGEFVVITGTINEDGSQGVAMEVSYSGVVKGEVTLTSIDDTTLEILGQLVHIDTLTVFHGFSELSDLFEGNIVEVSGVLGAKGHIVATNLKLLNSMFESGVSTNVLKGNISNIDTDLKIFNVENVTVEYGRATLLAYEGHEIHDDQYVEVSSDERISGNTLVASSLRLISEDHNLNNHHHANIEGLVSRYVSSTDFDVNGLGVTTDINTRYTNGNVTNIAENTFIILEGMVNESGILLATHITFRTRQPTIELVGFVESIDVANNEIVIVNQVVTFDALTLIEDKNNHSASTFSLENLEVGDQVTIKGIALNNGKLLAKKLERSSVHRN